MDGWFFYYTLWTFWLIVTFLVPKRNHNRLRYSLFILISICLSTTYLKIIDWNVNAVVIFWFFSCMVSLSALKIPELFYQVCVSLLIMLVYDIFLLFELYDPVWVFMDREWLLTIIICVVAIFLNTNIKKRIVSTLIGLIMGEWLYAFVLFTAGIHVSITTSSYLDICSTIGISVISWSCLESLLKHINKTYSAPKPHIEKEKQKPG